MSDFFFISSKPTKFFFFVILLLYYESSISRYYLRFRRPEGLIRIVGKQRDFSDKWVNQMTVVLGTV